MNKSITNSVYMRFTTIDIGNITIAAPNNIAAYTLILPINDGISGQVLSTDGVGNTSWITPSAGTVSSVGLVAPSIFTVTNSPVTTSGNLTLSYSGTALPPANGGTGLTALGANNTYLSVVGGVSTWRTDYDGFRYKYSKQATWSSTIGPTAVYSVHCWSPQLGLYVAIANGICGTSPNGVTWTARTVLSIFHRDVCWSPELGLFAICASTGVNNRISTSPDGITWTARTTTSDSWYVITWIPQLLIFLSISDTGLSMTSPDGITWTMSGTVGGAATTLHVEWAPTLGLAVVVRAGANEVYWSTNSVTWTQTVSTVGTPRSLCWSPELGIFVMITTTNVYTSTNGTTWTIGVANPASTNFTYCAWSGAHSVFVATSNGASTSRIGVSYDGVTWTYLTETTAIRDIIWSEELDIFTGLMSATQHLRSTPFTSTPYNTPSNIFSTLSTLYGGTGSSSASTGTGGVVLSTTPTLITPILGVATATTISLPATITSAKISMYGPAANAFQFDGFGTKTNTLQYQVTNTTTNHVFYAGTSSTTDTELFRIKGTGGFTSTGASTVTGTFGVTGDSTLTGNATVSGSLVSATPLWGGKFQATNQSVGAASETYAQDLSTNIGGSALTASSTGYQNLLGRTVIVQFTYCVFWDPAVGGGVVQAAIRKNGTDKSGASYASVFATTYYASCTGSTTVSLANGDYIELWIRNNLGGSLSIKGTPAGDSATTQLYYYILN